MARAHVDEIATTRPNTMHTVRSPFARDALPRQRVVVAGLALPLLPHHDRMVPGGNLVYVEDYKTRFRPKPAEAQAKLLEGFQRLRGDKTQKAAALYLLDLDPEKAVAVWNDLAIDFILDGFVTRMVLGVYGIPALPGALGRMATSPSDVIDGLARADALGVAFVMARARLSSRSAKDSGKDEADDWLVTWPRTAAIALTPVAVGALGAARDEAESALRFLDKRGHGAVLREVAASYGGEVVAAMDEVLSAFELPKKPPKLPGWAAPADLPVLRTGDDAALDAPSTQALLELLAAFPPEHISTFVPFEEPEEGELAVGRSFDRHVARFHPEVTRAKEALTEASREGFVSALYAKWIGEGGAAKDKWALFASSALGGEETAARLHEGVLSSHREKKHARARLIVDALAIHGSARALAALSAIASAKALKETAATAEALLSEAARVVGMGPDELADVSTPNPSSGLTLAPGTSIAFDANLRLVGIDASGAPSPAPLPAKAWKALGEEAKRTFLDAAQRFERRMVERSRMSADHFRSVILAHPVLAELARRLVFGVYDGPTSRPRVVGHVETTRLVDRSGRAIALAQGELVGVLHPLELDGDPRTAWADTLAELRILQPFPQLGRPVFEVDEAERAGACLERFVGKKVTTGALLGLARLGWKASVDDRTVASCVRALGDIRARLAFAPGYDVGRPDPKEALTLGRIELTRNQGPFARAPAALETVDRVVFSELVREVSTLLTS